MGKKRRRRFRRRLLRFSPYIIVMGLGIGYVVKSFGGEIVQWCNYSSLRDNVVKEEVSDESFEEPTVETPETTLETIPESEEETIEEEVLEEESETEEEIKVEVISDELLSLGYNFPSVDLSEPLEKMKILVVGSLLMVPKLVIRLLMQQMKKIFIMLIMI